ncbi:DUF2783 domain-containing protein [Undibacterium sp. TJN25]|uniref:DUF2783 domain-containing protein n=1 Tax=Undibacterium sp. TJN25 TaxID=3413056 RepID=UPI003BF415DA
MNEQDIDRLYTALCTAMTDIGAERSPLLLARFALLAMLQIGDAAIIEKMIADVREGLEGRPQP